MGKNKKKTEWGVGDPAISIVKDHFCNPYPMELIVKRKVKNFSKDYYQVCDLSGNLLLEIDGKSWKLSGKRAMRDPAGFTILTMRQKEECGLKDKWEVHRGDSKEKEDLLFTVQDSKAVSLKKSMDVFLPDKNNNSNVKKKKKKKACDFHVSGGIFNLSFKAFKSDALIAKVAHKFKWESFRKGICNFKVRVKPEVDYVFIIALLVIIDD